MTTSSRLAWFGEMGPHQGDFGIDAGNGLVTVSSTSHEVGGLVSRLVGVLSLVRVDHDLMAEFHFLTSNTSFFSKKFSSKRFRNFVLIGIVDSV